MDRNVELSLVCGLPPALAGLIGTLPDLRAVDIGKGGSLFLPKNSNAFVFMAYGALVEELDVHQKVRSNVRTAFVRRFCATDRFITGGIVGTLIAHAPVRAFVSAASWKSSPALVQAAMESSLQQQITLVKRVSMLHVPSIRERLDHLEEDEGVEWRSTSQQHMANWVGSTKTMVYQCAKGIHDHDNGK